jgi:hypothetical protein
MLAMAALCVSFPTQVEVFAQTVLPRLKAAVSANESTASTFETSIAVGLDYAMAVYHVGVTDTERYIGYALAERSGSDWTWIEEGVINPSQEGYDELNDPSVAYDAISGEFLVCAVRFIDGGNDRSIILARWDGSFSTPNPIDKPWIVAGEMIIQTGPMGDVREYYIFWFYNGLLADHMSLIWSSQILYAAP